MKERINDERLTPTMDRVRSGSNQIFKEGEITFTLTHEKKSIYADLIDGEWFWVEGCGECRGEERGWNTYIECEEHNRCRVCEIKRKDLKEIPWGGSKGWICKPCQDAKDKEIRKQAFERLNGKEPDTLYVDEIICPHCGTKINDEDLRESTKVDCHVCEGEMNLEVEWTPTYSTTVIGERLKS